MIDKIWLIFLLTCMYFLEKLNKIYNKTLHELEVGVPVFGDQLDQTARLWSVHSLSPLYHKARHEIWTDIDIIYDSD